MTDEPGERRVASAAPEGWLPVRVRGATFAVPPAWIVEGSGGSVRAWNRRHDPDRTFLLQAEPTTDGTGRQAARTVAAAESNGDRVVAESRERLDGVPAIRAVFARSDGGTTVAYLTVHRGRAWDVRIVVTPDGGPDAVVEFERVCATFRFDDATPRGRLDDRSDGTRSGA